MFTDRRANVSDIQTNLQFTAIYNNYKDALCINDIRVLAKQGSTIPQKIICTT